MLNAVGDIIHASCSSPAGSGPSCTSKHTAALCYALEDLSKCLCFLKTFHHVLVSSAESFLCELEQWSKESNPSKNLLMNTVAIKNSITNVSRSNSITKNKTELKNCLKVTEDKQLLIQENTLLQSRLSDWFTLRQLRITGSIVSRICNYFLFMKSNPNIISNAILEPSTFSSAAMKYGLDMEPTVINRYVAEKVKEGSNISIKKLGLIIDKDHGFIAVSPDGGIEENNSLVGIVECKVAVKWSHQTVVDCVKEPGYPLNSMQINQHGTSVQVFGLKPNYAWYHQIQLQLHACRSFAKYCDLALLHPDSGSL
ncbi:hypothetical protein ACJMK2_001184 [Sinanodonta woodiana]|uniref:YqaJ viral recombinase domain-containing protein n=1 Tax=Sinanodonta woodiana TaxID=1069815 RepID=A0ABD3XRI5_SINWO